MDSWHSRPQADLFQELDARPGGLTRRQAEERLARYGPNQLEPPRRPGLLSRVMAQMKDPMILVLLGAAGLSLAASRGEDWLDAAIILVIVVVNNIISISQEDHAHRALEELRKMTSPHATALRGGRARPGGGGGAGAGGRDPAGGGGPGACGRPPAGGGGTAL